MTAEPPAPSLASQWITPRRLQWIMDVGESTVAQWVKENRVPHFRMGRLIRFDPAVVAGVIRSCSTTGKGTNGTNGTNGTYAAAEDDKFWGRMERLLADQVRAALKGKDRPHAKDEN